MAAPIAAQIHNLLSLAGALTIVLLAWLLGDSLLRHIRLDSVTRLERALFGAGLGLGILSTSTLLVGLSGGFTRGGLCALLALSVLTSFVLRAVPNPLSPPPGKAPQPSSRWAKAVALLGALFLLGLLPSVLTPMVDPDGLAYHVGAPKRWLEMGRIVDMPTHLHTLWPMGNEMLNGLLLATVGDRACKPLIWIFALLGAGATFALANRLASASVGLVAASILLLRAGAPGINTTSVEMPLTFYLVLAALALALQSSTEDPRIMRRYLLLAAVMAGFVCATKLTGLLCLTFLVGAIAASGFSSLPWRTVARDAALLTLVAIACASPWYLRAWWITGNPIFPFAFSLLGGAPWDAQASKHLSLYFRSFDLAGESMADRALFVRNHLSKLAAMMMAGVVIPGAPRWVKGFILGAGLYAIVQVALSDNARFLLPATPFAAVALSWWLVRLSERSPWLGWFWAAGLAALILPKTFSELSSIPPVIWGGQSREAFVLKYVNTRPAFDWANTNLPADARVLYGPDNRTYFLQRDAYWSSAIFQRTIRYDTPAEFESTRRQAGVRWMILNRDMYEKDSATIFETKMGWREDERLRLHEAAAQGRLLFSANGVDVYELP